MTSVTKEVYGTLPEGAIVEKFHLETKTVMVEILSYGCIIRCLKTKDRHGHFSDIVLGFDDLEGYTNKHPYFGAVIGRVANRIAKGRFTVDDKEYTLPINNGPNSIHGGLKGFDKVLWSAKEIENGVQFSYTSADGEEGYPGELQVCVTYTLVGSELAINYKAQTTKTTPVNLTNHSYFNLAGQGSENIYDHEISIQAEHYLPVDDTMIPTVSKLSSIFYERSFPQKEAVDEEEKVAVDCMTAGPSFINWLPDSLLGISATEETGEIRPVQGTNFDLRKAVSLGSQIAKLEEIGFDHNFCLSESQKQQVCAKVHHKPSGRVLSVRTTQPGVQFYTANFLDGSLKGKSGTVYPKHSAFCLETQAWPDAVNKPQFPNVLLHPGEEYNQTTWFDFTVE